MEISHDLRIGSAASPTGKLYLNGVEITGAGGGGSGDVTGPVSSTNRSLALWADTSGNVLKDGPALGTAGHVLTSNGPSSDPSFQAIPASVTNAFDTVKVSGQSDVVAVGGDDLTFESGANVTITTDAALKKVIIAASGGASGYATVQEEGTPLTQRATMNFVGSAITASDTGSLTQVATHAQVNSLASLGTNGVVCRTASNTLTARTIAGTTNQVGVTDGDGVSGAPTIALASNLVMPGTAGFIPCSGTTAQRGSTEGQVRYNTDDDCLEYRNASSWIQLTGGGGGYATIQEEGSGLTQRTTIDFVGSAITASDTGAKTQVATHAQVNSLASLGTNGVVCRTASNTLTARTIAGTTNQIALTDGDGVAGAPTIALASNLVMPGTSNFKPVTGTTAQRPGSPTGGETRFNSDTKQLEYHNSVGWIGVIPGVPYQTKNASFTADWGNAYGVDSSGGAVTVTIAAAAAANAGMFLIVSLRTVGNNVTFNTSSSQTYDGQASGSLVSGSRYLTFVFMSTGTDIIQL